MTRSHALLIATVVVLAELAFEPVAGAASSTDAEASLPQVMRALWLAAQTRTWEPMPSTPPMRLRGTTSLTYDRVAPRVVVIRTVEGHGTGFLVDAGGWVLTNHHVVAGAATDDTTGAQIVAVYHGRLAEGRMVFAKEPVYAHVYKSSKEKDLALLKLTAVPDALRIEPLALAPDPPAAGTECAAVGHPGSAMLWTSRSCEVSRIGVYPDDLTTIILLGGEPAPEPDDGSASTPFKRRIIVSSCALGPGDSGGPLVNARAEVIGVSYGVGPDRSAMGGFSYHTHVSEIADFIKDRPDAPPIFVPDPWAPSLRVALEDADEDGKSDTVRLSLSAQADTTGVLLDLDQDSPTELKASSLTDPSMQSRWDFEFAITTTRPRRAFYDRDNDGALDLILTDMDLDGRTDSALSRQEGRWQREMPRSDTLLDAGIFESETMRLRFERLSASVLAPNPGPQRPMETRDP